MRIKAIGIGLVVGALSFTLVPRARAATTTHFTEKGTTANLNLTVSLPTATVGCTIDVWLVLTAASSVERANGTSGMGVSGFLQRADNCAGVIEFGSFNQSLTSGFSTAAHSASLATTIPVSMDTFAGVAGSVTRSLVVALQFQDTPGDTVASKSHSRITAPNIKLISNGQSVFKLATISGQVTLDGTSLITAGEVSHASIETSSAISVDITR